MKQENTYQGPLVGLNVIDFGHYYAGPMVGMNLADQGANVVRIVKPGTREVSDQQFRLLNRNKKVLELDLKTEQGMAQALALIEKADVLIENFRPGVMERLGLDYTCVATVNPDLIYLSMPGFASTDMKRRHIQAWEGVLNAAAGVYVETQTLRRSLNYPPVYTDVPQCSVYGAAQGSIAVMAALLVRQVKGQGVFLEVPLVEAGLSGFASAILYHAPVFEVAQVLQPYEYNSGDCLQEQAVKLVEGQQTSFEKLVKSPISRFWQCGDGRHILIWGAGLQSSAENFMKALDLGKQLKSEGFINEAGVEVDNNISMAGLLNESRAIRLAQLVGEKLLSRTAKEWEVTLGDAGVPCSLIRTREEFLALEPMHSSGVIVKMGEGSSILTVPGRVVDISGPEGAVMGNCFAEPEIVEVSDIAELFPQSSQTLKKKAVGTELNKSELLKGLKVLDLANIIAGPTSTYTLAQYGAKVIKLDPESYATVLLNSMMMEVNQGKRSILADLKTASGQDILHRLVSWADIVVHNSLDDVAYRLGLTHDVLQKINPNVVSCQLTAFGGSYRGGCELRKGFDPVAPACSGLMVAHGSLEHPQIFGGMSAADINAGLGLSFSALLGIYQQRKTGYAGEGRTSLIRTNCHFQLPLMIAKNGKINKEDTGGLFDTGPNFWQRIYACADGYIYVGATEGQASLLVKTVTGHSDTDKKALEDSFAKEDCQSLLSRLENVGIASHQVISLDDIHERNVRAVNNQAVDEFASEAMEVFLWEDHSRGSPLKLLASSWVRVGQQQSYTRLTPKPVYGEHTIEILKELSFSQQEIDNLIRFKVVSQ